MARPAAWVDVESVKLLTGWSAGWVRQVARRDGWTSIEGSRPRLYSMADVLASAEGHKAHAVERHLTRKHLTPTRRAEAGLYSAGT